MVRTLWPRLAGLVALAGLALVTTACAHQRTLRVMTYNIAAGHGDLGAVLATLRAAGADVVALQEVDVHWSERSGFADQASLLAAGLAMDVRFAPIYRLDPARADLPPRQFGLALLSRYPIASFENHSITRLSTQVRDPVPEPMPGFLDVTVRIDTVTLRIYNTHLDYRADARVRQAQVADMLRILGEVAGPVILLGDLNAPPHAPELQPLLRRLHDAWGDRPGGFTYPADAPDRRIDYVLTTADLQIRSVRVPDTRASDHRPVIAELVLPPKR